MTAKGFGAPKHPTQKEIDRFNHIVRIRKDYWASVQYRNKLIRKYGVQPVGAFIIGDPALWLALREIMPQQTREKLEASIQPEAERIMVSQFVEWGFEPGRDFSIGPDDSGQRYYFFSSELTERMEAEGFPAREVMERFPIPAIDTSNPDRQLDEHLGVPFTKNLVAALATAAASEPIDLTLYKIFYLSKGLNAANPQIGWTPYLLEEIAAVLGDKWLDRASEALHKGRAFVDANPNADVDDWCEPPDEEGWWVVLLSRAIEVELEYSDFVQGKELAVNAQIARRLHQVWRGEKMTFLELGNILDRHAQDGGTQDD